MKQRPFSTVFEENQQNGFFPGDEAAARAAAALADRADAPTIAALSDMLTFFERIGGQFHITSLRLPSNEGEWETHGLAFHFETRDARVKVATAPEDLRVGDLTIPITDSQGPAPEIELPAEEPAPPESSDEEPAPEA